MVRVAFWHLLKRWIKRGAQSREDNNARDTNRLYNDTMCKYLIELGDSSVRAPDRQELKNAERVTPSGSFDTDSVAYIGDREKVRRKWEFYHRSARRYRSDSFKASSSKIRAF